MNIWHSKPGGIGVGYLGQTNGGGLWFGQEYIEQCYSLWPGRIFRHCFEWCSGAGFIGFALMDAGICERLYFTDVYRPAIDCIRNTVARNPGLAGKIQSRVCGMIQSIPHDQKFDLVVANPPHFKDGPKEFHDHRINVDPAWKIHEEFFLNISMYLEPNGEILLQENQRGSEQREKTWLPWIEQGGLEVIDCYPSRSWYEYDDHTSIYYLHARRKN